MHTVVETPTYLHHARDCGLSQGEMEAITAMIANDPMCGDEIAGTGGCRKVRVARQGKGKSGGFRLVTFFSGQSIPVFLITIYAKNRKDNLTGAETNALKARGKEIVAAYRSRVVALRRTR